jgi:hypothetical protein
MFTSHPLGNMGLRYSSISLSAKKLCLLFTGRVRSKSWVSARNVAPKNNGQVFAMRLTD